jgi:phage antirepressor YoqD-like protein
MGKPSALLAILRPMAEFSDVVLESVGVQSYADLVALGPEDILRFLDDKKPLYSPPMLS